MKTIPLTAAFNYDVILGHITLTDQAIELLHTHKKGVRLGASFQLADDGTLEILAAALFTDDIPNRAELATCTCDPPILPVGGWGCERCGGLVLSKRR